MAKTGFINVDALSSIDRHKLKSAIQEMNDSMIRIASENDLQKDVLDNVAEELGIDKKLIRRVAKTYFKSSFNNEVEENKQFQEFYSNLLLRQDIEEKDGNN